MKEQQIHARCEICINFKPDDTRKHILKNLSAKNPSNKQYYEQVAGIVGGEASSSTDMGYCHFHKKDVKETDLCDEFLHDISKEY